MKQTESEVIVVGGGIAGCAAAVSSARAGKRTLLLERAVTLGGLATNGLVNFFEPLCNGRGDQLIYGIAEEMLKRVVELGWDHIPQLWKTGTEAERAAASGLSKEKSRYVSKFSPALCALSLFHWLKEEGVEVVFDALLTSVRQKDGEVLSLRVETASGAERFSADRYIDATGSAELFHRAGFSTAEGGNAVTYMAHAAGDVHERKWVMSGNTTPWRNEGDERIAGTSREAVNRMVQEGQLALYEKLASGGVGEIVSLPAMPQFRTVRRIAGMETITEKDANRPMEESLGVGGHFDKPGVWYEIPYGALVSGEAKNAVAAGRIISAEGDAWNATRVIPVAALTGELAGIVAAASLDLSAPVFALDYADLRDLALARGLRLHG